MYEKAMYPDWRLPIYMTLRRSLDKMYGVYSSQNLIVILTIEKFESSTGRIPENVSNWRTKLEGIIASVPMSGFFLNP